MKDIALNTFIFIIGFLSVEALGPEVVITMFVIYFGHVVYQACSNVIEEVKDATQRK